MKPIIQITLLALLFVSLLSCGKEKGCTDESAINYNPYAETDDGSCSYDLPGPIPPIGEDSNVKGFGILTKLSGIWNGPVYSPTPLGSFPEWIVDFRPISPSQISAKNELDALNDIFMSFFICKHDNEYKVAFRNGGGFAGAVRTSYMVIDSLSESASQSFYRFIDPVQGENRVYTDITLRQDSLTMKVYTNQFNSLSEPTTHMIWTAQLKDSTSAQEAVGLFNFPKKELTIDFSSTFNGLVDAVFYSTNSDPYPEQLQPYLGTSSIGVSFDESIVPDSSKKVILLISTQPLFDGWFFIPENLDFLSRYVRIPADGSAEYNFNYMHPGDYFVNAIYDTNGDFNVSSGDYMNGSFDLPFTLTETGLYNTNIIVNLQIP